MITILDPFENERNVAVTLHPTTDALIKNVFRNAYQHFTTCGSLPDVESISSTDIMASTAAI